MRKLAVGFAAFGIMIAIFIVSGKNNNQQQPNKLPPQQQQSGPPNQPKSNLQQALQTIERPELEADLKYLCSPNLEGRMSGMKGNETTATWISQKFQAWGLQPQLQTFGVRVLNEHKEKSSGRSSNIIGVLPGNHPTLRSETIVVGAHMDHIGYGPAMSQAAGRREIHPGADDNASGTVVLMAIAKASSLLKGQNNRTIVFIAFSGEEMGLYGSKHYVDNPLHPNTVFMLNMDMVGRYNNKGTLSCLGAGSSPEVRAICESLKGYTFRANCTSGSGGGSDHAPFYQKHIPICFLHTGQHNDYHTPDDTPDKIDYNGLTLISKFGTHLVWEIDRLDKKPSFTGIVSKDEDVFRDHDFMKGK